jgi:arsenical pump membrane protein
VVLAVLGAGLLALGAVAVLTGLLPIQAVGALAARTLPVLGFVAAITVVAALAAQAGVFVWIADGAARLARGRTGALWLLVVLLAVASTVFLSLDTTAVLLTPIVVALARRVRLSPLPFAMTAVWLANTASLLLPVSNLTNLLAVRAAGIPFTRFAVLMVLPWAVAIGVEWVGLRRAFASELAVGREVPPDDPGGLPRAPLYVLAGTLAGFVASGVLGIDAAWPAGAGALAMLALERPSPRRLLRAVDLPLLGFVLGLGVIVSAVARHGLGDLVASVLPSGAGVLALIGAALVAALAANLLNNVPALLVLLPAAVASGPATVCAVLIGVNAGPNLTYTGSLATLLWRRVLRAHGAEPPLGEFLRLGAVTVPPILIGATVALWLAVQLT